MTSFADLKKNAGSNLEKLKKAAEALNKPSYNDDSDKYWKPEPDKAGNAFAIIRFLPPPPVDGDDGVPYVKYFDHGFQGPGGWYIQKSLTTIGQQDSVAEMNKRLWDSGVKANRDFVSGTPGKAGSKRRLHFVSNIYVVKDSKNPHNEGKTFLFAYGSKIMEKITKAIEPQFEDEVAFDPFDLYAGANFKLKVRKVDGYTNYNDSEWAECGPLLDDDAELERIWNSEHSLLDIIDPKNFKSYDELKAMLDRAMGTGASANKPSTETPRVSRPVQAEEEDVFASTEEDSEDMDYFNTLMQDDD